MEPDLSLVIPAFNEAGRLPRTLEHLKRFAGSSGLSLEVVVADDGSTDGTAALVRDRVGQGGDRFTVALVEIAHRGKGAAVREGMNHVHGRIVGCFDADLSPGTDAIPELLRAIERGADMAIASRGLPESVIEVHPAWYREVAGHVFNFLLRKLAGIPFRDTQCGLKLWRAEVAREIFRYQRVDGFAFDAELVVLASRLGYRVDEIPICWAHSDGSRVSLLRDAVRMSRDVFRIVRKLGRGRIHAPGIPSDEAMDVMSSSEDRHWWYVAKREVVLDALRGVEPGPCLDLGCGGGAMLAAAAAASHAAFGVDLSPQALDYASRRGLTGLVRAEAGALPFASGSFRSALLLDVLEHHARPDRLLAELRRVLDPDGLVVVTVPAFQWMWSYADHVLGHYRRYTRRQLEAELGSCGFEVTRVTYFHSWLLPVAWLFRKLRALIGSTDSADDFEVPAPLNRLLLGLSRLEMRALKRWDMPFGLSVLAVAKVRQRVAGPAAEAGDRPRKLQLTPEASGS